MTVHENFPLSEIVYYKIGGKARFLLGIQSEEDLQEAFRFIQNHVIEKVMALGIGANILISDKGFDGVVLHFKKPKTPQIKMKGDMVEVFAGQLLDDLIQFSFGHQLVGLEWAGGLPSTVGAAIRGNVGAFGGEIKDSVVKVEIVEKVENEFINKTLLKEDLEFSYRNSIIKQNKNLIIIGASFKLKKATSEQLIKAKQEYQDHIQYRETHHPMEYPSCGSVFKNITEKEEVQVVINTWSDVQDLSKSKWHGKISMGYVIDRLGFTGKTKGGAQVAERHSNYIVNKNNASFDDVVGFINEIKESFFKTFGFYPEPEVEIVSSQ